MTSTDAEKFEVAWSEFAPSVADAIMNEATFQAWWAAYLTKHFELRRVVREIDFNPRRSTSEHAARFNTRVALDVAIARTTTAQLPNRSYGKQLASECENFDPVTWRGGWPRLNDLSVVSEFKVGSSAMNGVNYGQLELDYVKLSMILHEAGTTGLTAFMCILDNHPTKRINRKNIANRVQDLHKDIRTLWWPH